MNTLIKNTLFLLMTILILGACSKREVVDYGREGETGTLKMQLDVKVTAITTHPQTRTGVPTDNFIVKICKAATGEVAKDVNGETASYTYSSMPEIITLSTGKYYILAYSHEPLNAAWDTPYYEGKSNEFEIKKAALTTVNDITCKLQNVKVTISYSETVHKELTEFTVTVDNGLKPDGFLIFGKDDESKAAYFTPTPTLTVSLNGIRRDGEIVSHTQTITDVNPGEERQIKLDIILTGSVSASLKVDMNVTIIDHTIKVPGDEGTIIDPDPNPEPGEPEEPEKPSENSISIKGQGFNIDSPIAYPTGTSKTVIVNITADYGIKELWVEIDSPFLTEEELNAVGLGKKFNLADPSMFSLFGPNGLKLIESSVVDATELNFDITLFTDMILIAGTHKFTLTVKDDDNQSLSKTLTLKTE